MKQSVKELQGDAILAKDGSLGEVLDVYFDDERWAVGRCCGGAAAYPGMAAARAGVALPLAENPSSARRVAMEARDGEIGEVDDLALEEDTWAIAEVIVDTRKWWPGGQVRIAPQDVESIDWPARKMRVRLMRDEVKASARA